MAEPLALDARAAELRQQNRVVLFKLLTVVVVMLGFAYAMVPLYRQICEVLGINQTRVVSTARNTQVDSTREVSVDTVANQVGGLPWRFEALQKAVRFHPGEWVEARYRVTNTLGRDITAQARYSLAPERAGRYLQKRACFCFENQVFKAGETRELVVQFQFSADLPEDVPHLSMAYTFFDVASVAGKS